MTLGVTMTPNRPRRPGTRPRPTLLASAVILGGLLLGTSLAFAAPPKKVRITLDDGTVIEGTLTKWESRTYHFVTVDGTTRRLDEDRVRRVEFLDAGDGATPPPKPPTSDPAPPVEIVPRGQPPIPAPAPVDPRPAWQTSTIAWLEAHQSKDGRWDVDGWQRLCAGEMCQGARDERGDPRYDVGVTALAALALIRLGEDPGASDALSRALDWITTQAPFRAGVEAGAIGFRDGEQIYNHAIATLALAEAEEHTSSPERRAVLERAVNWSLAAQNPGLGWKYGVRPGKNDTSVTGWMLAALDAARRAGIEVPDEAFRGGVAWLDRATSKEGVTGYQTPGGGSSYLPIQRGRFDEVPSMTAVALLGRAHAGLPIAATILDPGRKLLLGSLPEWETPTEVRNANFYYWFHATGALRALGTDAQWSRWRKSVRRALERQQRMGGPESGSWDPIGEWCIAGGRVYATAINALTLEQTERPRPAAGARAPRGPRGAPAEPAPPPSGPLVELASPEKGLVTTERSIEVNGHVRGLTPPLVVRIDGRRVEVEGSRFSGTVRLREGINEIDIVAADADGGRARARRTVVRDSTAPGIKLEDVADVVRVPRMTIDGHVDEHGCTVWVGGKETPVVGEQAFYFMETVTLAAGRNEIEIVAKDPVGNITRTTVTVTYKP